MPFAGLPSEAGVQSPGGGGSPTKIAAEELTLFTTSAARKEAVAVSEIVAFLYLSPWMKILYVMVLDSLGFKVPMLKEVISFPAESVLKSGKADAPLGLTVVLLSMTIFSKV